jgi:hypothetical protein
MQMQMGKQKIVTAQFFFVVAAKCDNFNARPLATKKIVSIFI